MSGDACSAGPTAAGDVCSAGPTVTGTRALTDEEIREFLQKCNAAPTHGPWATPPVPPVITGGNPVRANNPCDPGLIAKDPEVTKAAVSKQYRRSVITGKLEEVYNDETTKAPDVTQPLKPVSSYDHAAAEGKRKSANERMKNRTVSIERGMETGYADAMNGKKASMGALGSIDEWFAHGYRTGYARFEKEQS